MCDTTASESNFLMFYSIFQLDTSCRTHVQNHIENSVFEIVSKNFVIFAIFDKNLHIFRRIELLQENAAKPIAMHRQICLLSKKKNIITFY